MTKGVVVVEWRGRVPGRSGRPKYQLPGASAGSTVSVRVATLCGAARRVTTALPRLHKWRLACGAAVVATAVLMERRTTCC